MKPKPRNIKPSKPKKKSNNSLFYAALIFFGLMAYFWIEEKRLGNLFGEKCAVTNNKWKKFSDEKPENFAVHGIDVSHYSCNINWEAVKNMDDGENKVDFVFMRATRGAKAKDEKFDDFWYKARQYGLARGAYHFFNFTESPEMQARFYLQSVTMLPGDLPPVLDIEDDKETPKELLTSDFVLKRIIIWLKIVEQTTRKVPIIYCNQSYYARYIRGRFPNNPIWIASYAGQSPQLGDKPWLFWQYSNTGRCAGISEKIDLNVFNGTKNDFEKFINSRGL